MSPHQDTVPDLLLPVNSPSSAPITAARPFTAVFSTARVNRRAPEFSVFVSIAGSLGFLEAGMWAGNCVADLAVSLTAEQARQAGWTSAELPVPDSPAQASLLLRISPWVARLAKSPGRRSVCQGQASVASLAGRAVLGAPQGREWAVRGALSGFLGPRLHPSRGWYQSRPRCGWEG